MKKILIVEDNELNMKLFYDILQYQNFENQYIEELKSKYKPYTFNNIENIIDTEKQSSIQIDQKINCAHYPHFIATNKNIAKLEFLK